MNARTLGDQRGAGQAWAARASFVVEAGLAVALAFIAASLVWTLVAPQSLTAGPVPPSRFAGSSRADAPAYRPESGGLDVFRLGRSISAAPDAASDADAPASSLNLIVAGARTSSGDRRGSAIITTPDGAQRVYAVGDEIIAGVVLERVEADRILLRRQGRTEALEFAARGLSVLGTTAGDGLRNDESAGAFVAAPSGPSASAERPTVSGADLLASIAPRPAPDGEDAIALHPRGDGAVFAAAGFEPGDVVLGVNGRSIDSAERLREVMSVIAPGSTVEVGLRRGRTAMYIEFVVE